MTAWIASLVWFPISLFYHTFIPYILFFAAVIAESAGTGAFSSHYGFPSVPSRKKTFDCTIITIAIIAALCLVVTFIIFAVFGGHSTYTENGSYFLVCWNRADNFREISYSTYVFHTSIQSLFQSSVMLIFTSISFLRIHRLYCLSKSHDAQHIPIS